MFKITNEPVKAKLVQSSQQNPILWAILRRTGETTFEYLTPKFKCKDYFNDFVSYIQYKASFQIYGMQSSWVEQDVNGSVWVEVSNLGSQFEHNFKTCLPYYFEKFGVYIHYNQHQDSSAILEFRKECWSNTLIISVLTLIIRNCNLNTKFSSRTDLFNFLFYRDCNYNTVTVFVLGTDKLDLLPYKEYVWFAGEALNSTKKKRGWIESNSYIIHDNGITGWCNAFKLFENKEFMGEANAYVKSLINTKSAITPTHSNEDEYNEDEWEESEEEENEV